MGRRQPAADLDLANERLVRRATHLPDAPVVIDRRAELQDRLTTFLSAGPEARTSRLWGYLLSENPECARRLHDEVDRVLQGRLPTVEDLPTLPYIERAVTEAMRLYPPAWLIGRRAIAEYAFGPYVAPPCAILIMSPFIVQRDARFYRDPERFDPDRWTAAFKASLPPFAYFPFGGGPRRCIGESFAWMELILIVATIAQRWDLRLVPGHPVAAQPLITLRAKHGMRMTLAARA